MSWRATLLGAVPVVIAGLAVGVAIGGKTITQVDTVTVVKKIRVQAPAASAQTPTANAATGATTPPSETAQTSGAKVAGPQEQFLADYLNSQGGAETLNNNAENASLNSNPSGQELAGQTYQHAVAFDLDSPDEGTIASYQVPTPGFSRLKSNAIGLDTTANANANYRLTVYKNDDSSPNSVILYQASFKGPSTVRKLNVATQGATDLLFVWTHKATEPDDQDTFILADPVLSSGS